MRLLVATLLAVLGLAACGSAAQPPAIPTATQPLVSTAVSTSAPTNTPAPTAPPPPLSSSRAISFTTKDDSVLHGTLYGQGDVAVIFSTMSDTREDTWKAMAQALADRGYLALTYDFRFWVNNSIQASLRDKAADDLEGAMDFVRQRGAQRIVLIGASLGGMATIKAALADRPTAVIVLASPLEWPTWPNLRVTIDDVKQLDLPKLFINSMGDDFADDTQRMFDAASEPKQIHLYPGKEHGTNLFRTQHGADLTNRIIAFLEDVAPAVQPQ